MNENAQAGRHPFGNAEDAARTPPPVCRHGVVPQRLRPGERCECDRCWRGYARDIEDAYADALHAEASPNVMSDGIAYAPAPDPGERLLAADDPDSPFGAELAMEQS